MLKRSMSMLLAVCMILTIIGISPQEVVAAAYDETTYVITGNQRTDIVEIAKTQVGYKGGTNSSQLDGNGPGGKYTKYHRDMGLGQGEDWCACFVSWCAMKAGALNTAVINTFGCGNYIVKSKPYKKNGIGTLHPVRNYTYYYERYVKTPYQLYAEDYKPRKGDFFLTKTGTSSIGHVGIVVDIKQDGTIMVVDGNNEGRVKLRPLSMTDGKVVAFYSPEYNETGGHWHSWRDGSDSAHPHANYKYCACGAKYYVNGSYNKVASCQQCYPLGNVNLTRSFSKTGKTATFYRNNVANASSYTLTLYKENVPYNTYNMNTANYTISDLASGNYTAKVTASSANTGESRTAWCQEFTIANTYAVTFHANGGSNAPAAQTKIQDEDLTLTSSVPTKEHYVFKGWATAKNATEVAYEAGATYSKNTAITLYAVWEPKTYTVNFNANGGVGELSPIHITYGDTTKMPNSIVLSGSYLRGWGTSASASTIAYRLGMDYKIDKDLNLYAIWAASTWENEVAESFAGGSGTEADPYQISDASELAYLAHLVNSQTASPEYKYYILTDNIDFNFAQWVPIGIGEMENQYFYGSFDGNGYTISNMTISTYSAPYVGLFGYIKDSEIKNLNFMGEIYNLSLTEQMNIGAVAGYSKDSTVKDCNVVYINISSIKSTNDANRVSDFSNVGCIVGKQDGGVIQDSVADDCYMSLQTGSFNAGIIAGYSNGEIIGCSVNAEENLVGTGNNVNSICFGGIVGTSAGTIERCSVKAGHMTSTLKLSGGADLGGIVGNLEGKISLCSVQYTNEEKVDSVYAEGMSAAEDADLDALHMGGIVGYMNLDATLNDCKYDGKGMKAVGANGDASVGGLVGGVMTAGDEAIKVKYYHLIDFATLPTKNGYQATWYTDADLSTPYNFGQVVTSDLTLYAKWEKEETLPVWDGTSKEPVYDASSKTYTITRAEELAWIADVCAGVITTGTNFPADASFSGYTVVLAKDIALNDTSSWKLFTDPGSNKNRDWKIIGSESNPFKGTFDGQGKTVYGLYFSGNSVAENVGLFGYVSGSIQNVNMSHVYMVPTGQAYGSVVGNLTGTLSNCNARYNVMLNYTKGDSTSTQRICYMGGIVGYLASGSVSGCATSKDTKLYIASGYAAGSSVGGIVGGTGETKVRITDCYNAATIHANYEVGGIVGLIHGSISRVQNAGTISYATGDGGQGMVGGIAGHQRGDVVSIGDAYNTGNVTGIGSCVGGILGYYYGVYEGVTDSYNITDCYNTGAVTLKSLDGYGYYGVGGIVGSIKGNSASKSTYTAQISHVWNGGAVTNTGTGYGVGGIIGSNDSTYYNVRMHMQTCYNTATVSGQKQVGGILGAGFGTTSINHYIYNSYNAGAISGKEQSAGLVGYAARAQFRYSVTTGYGLYHTVGQVSSDSSYNGIAAANLNNYLSGYTYDTSVFAYPYFGRIFQTQEVKTVTESDVKTVLKRSFANIDGDLNSTSSKNASAGGILGVNAGKGTNPTAKISNLLSIADGVYSASSGASYMASSGLILGKDTNAAVALENTYAYSDTVLDAVNSANANNISEDSTCTETKPTTQIQRLSFLNQVFGPTAYQSLSYLETDETAVWVLKNNQWPELYYNCLNDIRLSAEIEHGSITLDKEQAVDGEIVTITPVPDSGYEFHKFYVNGEEGVGTTFEVRGDSEVYAIFSPVTAQYDVTLEPDENANGSLINADAVSTYSLRTLSAKNSLSASDGEEIMVSAEADELYTIDSVCVNGEEIAGTSFILEEDTVVTLSVSGIDTKVYAVTDDAKEVGVYYAVLSGSVADGDEETVKYINYWESANPDVVYTTEIETGTGAYEVTLDDLLPSTAYSYQMLDEGEVKTFTTLEDDDLPEEFNSDDEEIEEDEEEWPITVTVSPTAFSSFYVFTVTASQALNQEVAYIAVYDDNNVLLTIEKINFAGSASKDITIPKIPSASQVRVFVWDTDFVPMSNIDPIDL